MSYACVAEHNHSEEFYVWLGQVMPWLEKVKKRTGMVCAGMFVGRYVLFYNLFPMASFVVDGLPTSNWFKCMMVFFDVAPSGFCF